MTDNGNLLQMRGISKTYPGVKALDNVAFNLKKGEVHALVGENGAGKSTLIKILMGIEKKDSGEIYIEGAKVEIKNPLDAAKHEIAAVFQELSQIPDLTVAENIFLGKEKSISKGLLNRMVMRKRTRELLEMYDIDELNPDDIITNLSTAKRQLSEIVKAIAIKPKILILDEPTSALTEREAEKLFGIIDSFKKQGIGIVYISHRINELKQLADRITVLRDGSYIDTRVMAEVSMNDIVKMMVGREVDLYVNSREIKLNKQKKILEIKNINKPSSFKNISFELYEGEILGIAGLVGSGRSELMDIIFGIDTDYQGEIYINGEKANIRCVKDAMDHGIALVPESRHIQGLILKHSIEDNITLPVLKQFENRRLLNHKKKRKFASQMIDKYGVKTDSSRKVANFLSGGNQQKVVIAKWLSMKPKILIVDELTAGIDVRSRAEIHKLIRSLTHKGLSVIMISSEMSELLAHSDRVIIMNDYKILGVLEGKEQTQHKIMSMIMKDKNNRMQASLGGGKIGH